MTVVLVWFLGLVLVSKMMIIDTKQFCIHEILPCFLHTRGLVGSTLSLNRFGTGGQTRKVCIIPTEVKQAGVSWIRNKEG